MIIFYNSFLVEGLYPNLPQQAGTDLGEQRGKCSNYISNCVNIPSSDKIQIMSVTMSTPSTDKIQLMSVTMSMPSNDKMQLMSVTMSTPSTHKIQLMSVTL